MTPLDLHRLLVQLPTVYGVSHVQISGDVGQGAGIGQLLNESCSFIAWLDLTVVGWPSVVYLAFLPVHRAVATQNVGLLVAHAAEVVENRRRRRLIDNSP